MDSSYAKILQQQQLFLQLQILNQQQQQHYNYQTILPAPPKYGSYVPALSQKAFLPLCCYQNHCILGVRWGSWL